MYIVIKVVDSFNASVCESQVFDKDGILVLSSFC